MLNNTIPRGLTSPYLNNQLWGEGGGDEDGVCDYVFRTWFTIGFSVRSRQSNDGIILSMPNVYPK